MGGNGAHSTSGMRTRGYWEAPRPSLAEDNFLWGWPLRIENKVELHCFSILLPPLPHLVGSEACFKVGWVMAWLTVTLLLVSRKSLVQHHWWLMWDGISGTWRSSWRSPEKIRRYRLLLQFATRFTRLCLVLSQTYLFLNQPTIVPCVQL